MALKEGMKILESVEQFEEYYKKEGVVIFTFSANWCPDCRFIEPFMPKLVEKYSDYDFVYIDRDKFIDLAIGLQIMGIPSFVAVKNGKEEGRFVSKLRKTEKEIDEFLGAVR